MKEKLRTLFPFIGFLLVLLPGFAAGEDGGDLAGELKHSIDLLEIDGGGPPKDGIPSIDHPKFVPAKEADAFLQKDDWGIAVRIGEDSRFYPLLILLWHEIVNDEIAGRPVAVTYCPLCSSGIVFNPRVNGERLSFGTSGKLWNSNLLMYDRKTGSLWSQILGEAVVGEMTGTKLVVLDSDQVKFGDWKRRNPQGRVLSTDTGFRRPYGENPYGVYAEVSHLMFHVNHHDKRLDTKTHVLGLQVGDRFKAYVPKAVKKAKKLKERINGREILVRYEKKAKAVRMYETRADGTLERLKPVSTYWFCWAAVHPETDLFK